MIRGNMGSVLNGIRISPRGPFPSRADHPPNDLGAALRPGSAGRRPWGNAPKILNLMPLGSVPRFPGTKGVGHKLTGRS
jgi:hypothetical protein